ncbi:MAG: hypothetical protein GWP06_17885 [Actinobacteria bacterium]|nr:hypothetical protein [Actinomycetota bacterium]
MGRPAKIDIDILERMLREEGKNQKECADYFGVSRPAISIAVKKQKISVIRNAAAEHSSVIVEKKLNAIEQLQKINTDANELLDLCMKWQRGDDEALRILESQVKYIMVGSGQDKEAVKEFKFKDPRELALKAMAEVRNQLRLQLEIFKTLYDCEAVKEFQDELVTFLGEVDLGVRDEFIRRLREKGVIRSILEFPSN